MGETYIDNLTIELPRQSPRAEQHSHDTSRLCDKKSAIRHHQMPRPGASCLDALHVPGKMLGKPRGPIISIKAVRKRPEPLEHSLDIVRRPLRTDDIFDDNKAVFE